MPEIPQFQVREQAPYIADRAQASPSALAAPGLATERLGQQTEAVARQLGDLAEQHNVRAYNEALADATSTAYTSLETGKEEIRQKGNFAGFTQRQLGGFDEYARQAIDNAPTGVASRLERRFAVLRKEINSRAAAFEHTTGAEATVAGHGEDIDKTGIGLYRDPSRFLGEVGRVGNAIDTSAAAGWLNPQQQHKLKRQAEDTLALAAIRGRAAAGDNDALVGDLEKGRYDSFLTPQSLERLQPLIDTLKGHQLGRKAIGLATPGRATASQAVNADIPAEGRALLDSIAGPESGGAYDVRYTPSGGARFADLSRHPRIPEPGPEGPSTAAGRYQITASTNDEFAPRLGITDFSEKSQDTLGWTIAQDAYKKQTGGDLLDALKAGKLGEVQAALRQSGRWKTADLSTFAANLGKYQDGAGGFTDTVFGQDGAAHQLTQEQAQQYYKLGDFAKQQEFLKNLPPVAIAKPGRSPAEALAPDLDQALATINAAPGYTDAQRDKAITEATRDYHHWHQATAQERAQLLNDTQNATAMLASGRDATVDTPAIRRLLPREKADELLRGADEAREFGNAKSRVDAATPAELIDLQAKAHGALIDPTDFARKQRYTKALDAAIDQRQKALDPTTGDPAAYAMMVAPAVQEAWKAVDAQGTGNEAAVQATLAEQERLGVPAENRRALTKAQAAAIVTQIVTTDPGNADMGAALHAMAKSFGDRAWPVVFGDLVKGGLPAEAQILAAIDRSDQAAFRADFQRMLMTVAEKHGTEQLKKAAPHDQVQLIDQSIDGKLDALRATLWPDVKAFDAWKQGVRDLAYFYAFNGRAGDTALRDAYDGLIARKYDFDGRLRVPKGMLGAVDQAGDLLLGKIKPEQLGDITGNPALTPPQRQERALSAIRRGYWKTNENDTGAVRMAVRDDGLHIPAIVDGKRLEFSFADADKLAAGRPAMVAPPYMGP